VERQLRPLGVTARLEAPVRMAGAFAGTVCIEQVGARRTWLDDEIVFVGELADQVAQALLNADRHQAQESLRASEARYRSMLEAMDDLVYIASADCGVQYMNPAMIRRTGGDATGEPCHQAIHGLEVPCAWCSDNQRRGEGPRREITSPRDGRSYSVSNVPLHNQDGTVSRMSILRDTTEVRQAEAERLLLSAAIEQAAEMVLLTDTDGVIQYVNPAFEQVTGYTRAEAVGRTPAILKSGKQTGAFYDDLWNTIRSGKTWNGRFTNRKKDGTLYLEEAIISPVLDRDSRIASFVGVKRDISSQVRLEEQLRQAQKMEAVGQLAGGVAHDFNNLLTPILGYAELLQARYPSGDPTHAALTEIRRAAEGARRLTAQLLAFGRKQVIEMRVLELGGLVARMSRMLRRTIREDIEIVFKRAPEPSRFRGDASQIEQVVMNLAVNAQDAMPHGGRMTIETENVDLEAQDEAVRQGRRAGPHAVLVVSDSGVGMDAEILSHLFEPFFTTKEKDKGTGLGLATAYGIVKQHGGDIVVSSEPGRGSTFRVYLPRTDELDLDTERPPAGGRSAQRGTETIAVVEDNPMVRSIAVAMLTAHGYRVLVAAGGEDCLRQLEAHDGPVHLLLADVIMPGMNGRELYRRALVRRPALRVLFMSGYTEDVIAPQGVLEKDVDFIPKPFSAQSLTLKLREILDR
jgi:two-component system cell cycle sensor histidine kinase/response regulator CckA